MKILKPAIIIGLAVSVSAFGALNQQMRSFQGKLYDVNQCKLCVNVPPLPLPNGSSYFGKITSINPKNGKMSVLITLSADAPDKEFDEWHKQTVLIVNHPNWKHFSIGRKLETERYFNLGSILVTNNTGDVKRLRAFDYGAAVSADKK